MSLTQSFLVIRTHLNRDGHTVAVCRPDGASRVLGHVYATVPEGTAEGARLRLRMSATGMGWEIAP